MSSFLGTCQPITSAQNITDLQQHYENGFAYMAMTNYPTAASFLQPMPAWPVNVSCETYKDIPPTEEVKSTPSNGLSDDEKKFLMAINNASNTYYNFT